MRTKNIVIAYWADSELAFIEFARRNCSKFGLFFSLIKISHEVRWFTPRRSILANFLHLVKVFFQVLYYGFNGRVASFGTNTCRILFFFSWLFKDIHYVYNELPSFSLWSPAAWIDQVIFRFARNVSVSTIERANFVRHAYKLSRSISVLENITFIDIPKTNSNIRQGHVIFSGSITSKRFSDDDVEKMEYIVDRFKTPIDVYGEVAGDISCKFNRLINLKGKVSHARMLEIMRNYEYGLLSYYTGEPNYDLCAPLKLYEYLAHGCKVISLNKNRGLVAFSERYPALISFVSYNGSYDMCDSAKKLDEFNFQRDQFLANAILSNLQFAERLVA